MDECLHTKTYYDELGEKCHDCPHRFPNREVVPTSRESAMSDTKTKAIDRTVHAVSKNGKTQVTRYESAAEWYLEKEGEKRQPLTTSQAVEEAKKIKKGGGQVHTGLTGGRIFDKSFTK